MNPVLPSITLIIIFKIIISEFDVIRAKKSLPSDFSFLCLDLIFKNITNNIFAKNNTVNQIAPNYKPNTYCTNAIEKQTSHPEHESVLRHDIDCMFTALKPYQQTQSVSSQAHNIDNNSAYFAYKAQAWLAYAYSEDSEKSLTSAGAYALNEGLNILTKLQDNKAEQLALTTDIPPTSAIMRPDLWASLVALKKSDAIADNPRKLAFAEVQLVWAAAEYCERGWRHSNEHFWAAQRLLDNTQEDFINAQKDEDKIRQFQQDTLTMFKIFEPLDTGDDQCHQHQVVSLANLNK